MLYDVDPGNLEPDGFHCMDGKMQEFEKGYWEALWIGLLGEGGKIVRKKRLGTGSRAISGIQTGAVEAGSHWRQTGYKRGEGVWNTNDGGDAPELPVGS